MHVTYITHLPHNCTMQDSAYFKTIDDVMATIKSTTIKNKDCKNCLCKAVLTSSVDPEFTR